ncbi:Perlucin-like protein [Mytilus edulis]|uniref:Perlucin-like protein n=1 Tax=Mytilus edulis TaxID=6550 RepID=A0A8S3QQ98_MYTED|nr:Perlucin-like protein [Mytilus edulis]
MLPNLPNRGRDQKLYRSYRTCRTGVGIRNVTEVTEPAEQGLGSVMLPKLPNLPNRGRDQKCYRSYRTCRTGKQCNNMRGYLVKITDSSENSWVVDKITKSVKHRYGSWMGAADFKTEGHWTWVHDSSKVRFSNWSAYQPDNGGNNEDCVHFWKSRQYQWNDAPCHLDNMGYICECSHVSL